MKGDKPLNAQQWRQHMIRCWPLVLPELHRLRRASVPRESAVSLLVQLIQLPLTDETLVSMDLMIAASASLEALEEKAPPEKAAPEKAPGPILLADERVI